MAEVLYGSMKYDARIFEAGTPASKLPKAAREHARNVGFLVDKAPEPKTEPEPEVDEDVDEVDVDEVDVDEDEPDDEE